MDPVQSGIKRVGIPDTEITKHRLHPAKQPPGKGAAPAQLVFIDPRLAFMHPHRHTLPQWRQGKGGIDPLFVAGVANLMNRRIDAVERVVFADPCGNADIGARAGTERMHRLINPAPVEIIAKRRSHLARQRQLPVAIEPPLQSHRLIGRPQHPFAQRHQSWPHPAKQRADAGGFRFGFIGIEQRIIKIATRSHRRRLFAFQRNHLFQHRQEACNIICRPRRRPFALRHRGQPRQFFCQQRRHFLGAVIAALNMPKLRRTHSIRGNRRRQPLANPWVSAAGVQNPLQRRHLVTALIGSAAWHHGFLIPAQPPGNLAQRLGVALIGHQVVKRCHVGLRIICWVG